MTTLIRQGDMVYSDSCYGAPVGTERTRVFGEPKFFINRNKTVLIGICGTIPGTETSHFLTTFFTDAVERYFKDWKDRSVSSLTAAIEQYYEQVMEVRPNVDEYYSFVFFIKDLSLQIAVKVNKKVKRVRIITYGTHQDLVFGSGAPWWLAQKNVPNLTIEDKFKYIYQLDNNSGGNLNMFDLKNLKEIV